MTIDHHPNQLQLSFEFTDEKLADELILTPLANAKRNPRPARYVGLGSLTVNQPEGPLAYDVYYPLGHFRVARDDYRTADFSKLREYLIKALQQQAADLQPAK